MATPTTLPATFVAGAVLTAAQQNDLRGAFRVLQVVTGTTPTEVTNSTVTMEDTTLTATITPTSTSSKILVIVNHPGCNKSDANVANAIKMELHRGGSNIQTIGTSVGYTGSGIFQYFAIAASRLDSPSSVAALTYKTVFRNITAAASVTVQSDSDPSTITLMEISA